MRAAQPRSFQQGLNHPDACLAEAPQAFAEAAAAAPQTPPTSSETGLFVQPAPAAMQASLADHVGPVTPPPGSSSQVPPAPGSAQLRAPMDGSAQAEQPAQDMGQVWLLPGTVLKRTCQCC